MSTGLNKKLLNEVMEKLGFMPPPAPPGGAGMPPMDPSMMAGGMPPMDPAMMGGGMPPGGMPMDPAMMAGGMPPMDPAMMAGGMPPMDPAMMGAMDTGAPPAEAPSEEPSATVQSPKTDLENIEKRLQSLETRQKEVLDKLELLLNEVPAKEAGNKDNVSMLYAMNQLLKGK